jgi:hypothetical protein
MRGLGAVKELFYVRRHTCADGSFDWYVLNGHTLRRVGKPFPTRAKAEAERAILLAKLDLAKAKVLGRTPKGWVLMPLTMRPTALASPVDKDRQDFTVYSGEWAMGRIYEERGPEHMHWFWSLHGVLGKPPHVHMNDHAPTLEVAKAQFESAWKRWLAWATLSED